MHFVKYDLAHQSSVFILGTLFSIAHTNQCQLHTNSLQQRNTFMANEHRAEIERVNRRKNQLIPHQTVFDIGT